MTKLTKVVRFRTCVHDPRNVERSTMAIYEDRAHAEHWLSWWAAFNPAPAGFRDEYFFSETPVEALPPAAPFVDLLDAAVAFRA